MTDDADSENADAVDPGSSDSVDTDSSDSGDSIRHEKSFRGISKRLAIHYLENLGGDRVDEDEVVGDDWVASLGSKTIEIGPSVTLTEVTVVFEGPSESVEPLVERFSQKAMRAGG